VLYKSFIDACAFASGLSMAQYKLVARETEIANLKKLLDDAISGKGHILFVSGEAGIGKTRLVQELVSYAQDMGVLFIQGRCLYREGADPYLPFLDALRESSSKMAKMEEGDENLPLGISSDDRERDRELAPMGLVVMESGGDERTSGRDDGRELNVTEQLRRIDIGRERDRMYETISSMIVGIAKKRPLLFFLDDLHWADNATLQLLGYVVRNIRDARVLMVAAYRSEELVGLDGKPHPLTDAMQRINREGISETIQLKRLGLRETRHMLSLMFNRTDFPEGFIEMIFKQTEGNPYFVEEVVKSLVDQGIINPQDAQWHQKVDMTAVTMPSSVKTVITERIARLDPGAIKTLENASVIGQEFTFEILKGISEMKEEELVEALEKLMNAKLIFEDMSGEAEKYRFTHTMLREVVYENLSRTRRRMLHRKAATTMETVYKNKLGDMTYGLAYHFSNAGDLPKSAKYFSEAGHKALKSFAIDEAMKYYRSALDALEKLESSMDNLKLEEEVLVSLGNAHYTVGEWDSALEEFKEAIKLSGETKNESILALSHIKMGEIGEKRSDWTLATENFNKALETYTRLDDPRGIANVNRAMGKMYWRTGDYQRALEVGSRGLALFEKVGDKYFTAMALIDLGNVYNDMGEFSKSHEHYVRGLELAKVVKDPLEIARGYNNLGDIEMKQGRYDEAIALFEQSIEAGKKSGNVRQVGYALTNTGECLARKGDIEKAIEYLDRSITIFEKLDEKLMIGSIMMLRGIIYRNAKDWEMSRKCFLESTRIVEELNIPYSLGEHLLEYGVTCKMEGDKKEARRILTKALRIFENIGAKKYIEKVTAELSQLGDS